jgi:hypothetical protein
MTLAEIRCDAKNTPSSSVPRRLGFHLRETIVSGGGDAGDAPSELQVWVHSAILADPVADAAPVA